MIIESNTLITIGITCFNAEGSIEEAIRSALKQNWPNFEIVIVDDCSTDGSREKLKSISSIDSRIKIFIHDENKGFPSALNTIIDNAQGEFIAFFDDDDISREDRLTEQYKRITSYEVAHKTDMIICYSNRAIQRPNDNVPNFFGYAIGRCSIEPHGPAVADHILLGCGSKKYTWGLFGSCTMMARKNVYKKVGVFDPHFRRTAEWDFAIRASFLGAHFISVNQPLILQIKTISSDKSEKISQHYKIELRKKYKKYLKSKNAYWSSLVLAYSGNRQHWIKYYFTKIASIFLAPHIFIARKYIK